MDVAYVWGVESNDTENCVSTSVSELFVLGNGAEVELDRSHGNNHRERTLLVYRT